MPIAKIVATKRGKAAVAAALAFALISGWAGLAPSRSITPAEVHQMVAQGKMPPAAQLAIDRLIKPWEGLRTVAYLDSIGVPTVCWGETSYNGKPVRLGMSFTREQCDQMLNARVTRDYFLPLVDGVDGYAAAPVSVQASLLSGAYNFGPAAAKKSTAARLISAGRYREACEAQTAFNKAGDQVLTGLVKRREMGDAQRLGEAELCVSGLPS